MQAWRTYFAIGYTVTALKKPTAVVGMWEESRIFSIGEGAFRNFTIRAQNWWFSWFFRSISRRRSCCCWGVSFIASSSIWIITCFQFDVPMQVCRTYLAIGYTVTAVKEPMAVVGMSEES